MDAKEFVEKMEKTHVIILHETWLESFARDATSAAILLALWSLGHFADSSALEWIAVLLGGLILFLRVLSFAKGNADKRMTPQKAREWLDREFPQ